MAEKTMGAILNEASDANERTMESTRRSALVNTQLRGEVADQKWKEEERSRTKAFMDEAKDLGRNLFVKRVPRQNQQAAIPTGQPGEVVPPVEYDEVPIDLSSQEGIAAVNEYQTGLFKLRVKHGLANAEEAGKMVEFRRNLDRLGATQDFEGALKGDQSALARLSKTAGLDGVAKIVVGFDSIGSPNLFAITRKSDGQGGVVEQKVPIGHLAATLAPDFYKSTVGTAEEERKNRNAAITSQSDVTYKDRMGQAALTNAQTAASRNSDKAAAADQFTVFSNLESKNDRDYTIPGFTNVGPTGKAEVIRDDAASGIVNRFGALLIEQDGFTGGKAHTQARSMLAGINAKATQMYQSELDAAKAALQQLTDKKAKPEEIRKARQAVMELEDNGPVRWSRIRQNLVEQVLAEATQGNSQQGK